MYYTVCNDAVCKRGIIGNSQCWLVATTIFNSTKVYKSGEEKNEITQYHNHTLHGY